jgi:hypothetical protein
MSIFSGRLVLLLAAGALASCALLARGRSSRAPLGYADYARLHARLASGESAEKLADVLPDLKANLAVAADVSRRAWTDSTIYDEFARATILDDKVLDGLGIPHETTGGVEHVPAGLMHSYGYLFSQLKTAYGLKGKRWIESRVDERLGLPAGTFSPLPPEGEFLSNLTVALDALIGAPVDLPHAAKLAPRAPRVGAVAETVRWRKPDGSPAEAIVRTHLVALSALPGMVTADTHLLIYEVESGGERRLVTAFPVEAGFAGSIRGAKPADDAAFKPRFNFYVDPSWVVVSRQSAGFVAAP